MQFDFEKEQGIWRTANLKLLTQFYTGIAKVVEMTPWVGQSEGLLASDSDI